MSQLLWEGGGPNSGYRNSRGAYSSREPQYKIWATITLNSQDKTTKKSNITVVTYLGAKNSEYGSGNSWSGSSSYYSFNQIIYQNGAELDRKQENYYTWTRPAGSQYQLKAAITSTFDVQHDAEGNAVISLTMGSYNSGSNSYFPVNCTQGASLSIESGAVSLPQIKTPLKVKTNDGWQEGLTSFVKTDDGWQEAIKVFVKTNDGWQEGL